ncbi:flavodoxin [Enterococcus avium]|uniref:flavodoxin n=1 Tax=Enterococcus avium TaxID=33945 RepID=UPI00159D366E|nr:flavodoxin [Enterococcus avium]NVN78925.1 hypothetical protein [Enterococcus avium]
MKKLFWLLSVVLFLGACGSNATNTNEENTSESAVQSSESLESNQNQETEDLGKSLIVYHSLTENTKAVAEEIQKQVNGELIRIETVEPYPEIYDEVLDVVEAQREAGELPTIVKQDVDLSDYDSIFLGTPIWFGEPALPVEKWISENELAGKRIYPFFTSGSSSINESMERYRELLDQSTLSEGLSITSSDRSQTASLVKEWLAP